MREVAEQENQQLDDIDSRQDDVLRQLDELNEQVEQLIRECSRREPSAKAADSNAPSS